MTDNGDGTWSHTFTSDDADTYHQYKFINGNAWGSEIIPDACGLVETDKLRWMANWVRSSQLSALVVVARVIQLLYYLGLT